MINPCKGCGAPDRYPGCHSECERYLIWKSTFNKQKEKILKAKHKENEASEYVIEKFK